MKRKKKKSENTCDYDRHLRHCASSIGMLRSQRTDVGKEFGQTGANLWLFDFPFRLQGVFWLKVGNHSFAVHERRQELPVNVVQQLRDRQYTM